MYNFKRILKGVLTKMGFIKKINKTTEHKKVVANDEDYERIAMWKDWYKGNHSPFHKVSYIHNGERLTRRIKSLSLPKVTSKYIAKLLFNENVQINVNDKSANEFVQDVLKSNGFYKHLERYIEYGAALGGFVMKIYHDGNGNVKISFATADCMYPLSNDTENVDECLIVNKFDKNGKFYSLLEWNEWVNDSYRITTELYESESAAEQGKQVALAKLFPDIDPVVKIEKLSRPLFVYWKLNIANNLNLSSPLGVSVYGNAMDTLETLDKTFDAFGREIELGKKKVLIPSTFLKSVLDDRTGDRVTYFDSQDEVFQAYGAGQDSTAITDISTDIRSDKYIESINALLKIYATQVGLSAGTFTFDEAGLKTATEVVSEKSETYQTKNSHSFLLEESIKELIVSIVDIGILIGSYKGKVVDPEGITVDFDDSIAQDTDTTIARYTNAYTNGIMPLEEVLMRTWNLTEEVAAEWAEKIRQEKNTNADPSEYIGVIGRGDD